MNPRLLLFPIFTSLALSGCEPLPPQPVPGLDSPANAAAPESRLPRIDTLMITPPTQTSQPAPHPHPAQDGAPR